MPAIEQKISNLVASQFPAFYNTEGPQFQAFITAYYEWMEQTNGVLYQSRNLMTYADIDTTISDFIVYFTDTYLKGIPYTILADQRLAVKKIIDLYRAKGNIRALKLLFQLVYKEDIDIYLPGTDIFKLSDGVWSVPVYLEVTNTPMTFTLLGQQIQGAASGATAFVDNIVTRKIGSKYVYLLYLSNLSKDFITGEMILNAATPSVTFNAPIVLGSLTSLFVITGGQGFAVGDLVNLSSTYGQQGVGRVTGVTNVSGIVTFLEEDAGWGYTSAANVIISNTVLYLTGLNSTLPTSQRPIQKWSNLIIGNTVTANSFGYPTTVNVIALPLSGTFKVGENLLSQDGNANGIISSVYSNTYTLLNLSNYTGAFQLNEVAYQTNGTANTATGTVLYVNSTAIIVQPSNGGFSGALSVKGGTTASNANCTIATTSVTTLGLSNVVESYYASNTTVTGLTSAATANVLYFSTETGVFGLSGTLLNSYTTMSATYPATAAATSINGTFLTGEVLFQANSTANTFTGLISSVNSTAISVMPLTGAFNTSNTIQINTVNATVTSNTGAFIPGETIYQSNGTANTAYAFLISANTTMLVFNTTNGTFVTSNNVIGGLSGAFATISAFNTNISAANATVTSWTPVQTVNAVVTGWSTGNFANLVVASLNTTETDYFYTDIIGGQNKAGAPYVLIPLNAQAFGFPNNPLANLNNGYLVNILNVANLTLGEITSIRETNPGTTYNHAPYVEVYQPGVATLAKQDYVITTGNLSGMFFNGEVITQNVSVGNTYSLSLAVNTQSFTVGEAIYQVNTATTGTYLANTLSTLLVANSGTPNFTTQFIAGQHLLIGAQDIRVINNVVNSTALYLTLAPYTQNNVANVVILNSSGVAVQQVTNNTVYFTNSGSTAWATSSNVYGLTSGSNASVTSVGLSVYGTAQGRVQYANSTFMAVRRLSLKQDFSNTGSNIIGSLSGASANVLTVAPNTSSLYAGDNANIMASVVTSSGTVANLAVQASGIGFVNGEVMTFTSADGLRSGTAISVLGKQGYAQGYFSSTRGFTSADKYLQDGVFYQNFSYEIQSSTDIQHYGDMVRAVCHPAGTALFGAIVKKSQANGVVSVINNNGPVIGQL